MPTNEEGKMNLRIFPALIKCFKDYGYLKYQSLEMKDTEIMICLFIYYHSSINQDEIARAHGLDKTTIAKALSKLEEKKIILRKVNPKNRRENMISLTDMGKEKATQLILIRDKWVKEVCKTISEEDMDTFERVCNEVLNNAEKLLE